MKHRKLEIDEEVKVNVKAVERFNHALKVLFRIIMTPFVLLTIVTIVLVCLFFAILIQSYGPRDFRQYLSEIYRGQKFSVVEKQVDSRDNGIYKMKAKKYPEIVFNVYYQYRTIIEDYSSQRLKYHIEHCPNQEWIKQLTIEESEEEKLGVKFLKYDVWIDISSYEEIEHAVSLAYDITRYLRQQDETMYEMIMLRYPPYYYAIRAEEIRSYEEVLEEAKYCYFEANKEQQSSFSEKEKKESRAIWKPERLQVILNGKKQGEKETQITADYQLGEKTYYITPISQFAKLVDSIHIIEEKQGVVKKIEYQNKQYEFSTSTTKEEGNMIPYTGPIEILEEIFGANIHYDYENEIVEINII